MSMTKEQEDIYHETINGLMHKLQVRDDTIAGLRKEIDYLKSRLTILGDKVGKVSAHEGND